MLDGRKKITEAIRQATDQAGTLVLAALAIACTALLVACVALISAARVRKLAA